MRVFWQIWLSALLLVSCFESQFVGERQNSKSTRLGSDDQSVNPDAPGVGDAGVDESPTLPSSTPTPSTTTEPEPPPLLNPRDEAAQALVSQLSCEEVVTDKRVLEPTGCERYRYVETTVHSLEEADAECSQLGEGWALARVDPPCEVIEMIDHMMTSGVERTPTNRPAIGDTCSELAAMDWGDHAIFNANCSASQIILTWPGAGGCDVVGGSEKIDVCTFNDTGSFSTYNLLCENARCEMRYLVE